MLRGGRARGTNEGRDLINVLYTRGTLDPGRDVYSRCARDAQREARVGVGRLLATSGMSACLYTVLVVIAPARS